MFREMSAAPLLLLILVLTAHADSPVIQKITKGTVAVIEEGKNDKGYTVGIGSGVLAGNNYIWTAAHCVSKGETHYILFETDRSEKGVKVERREVEVVAIDTDEDLAILKIKGKEFDDPGIEFGENMNRGESVWHVGTWTGTGFINSLSSGIISQVYVVFGEDLVRDQTTAPIFPGSSGGGVFDSKGVCLGIVTTREEATFAHYIPYRVMQKFARKHKVEL